MPMIEPMLASATDSMTPSSTHLTLSMASMNSIRSCEVLAGDRGRVRDRRERLAQARPQPRALAVLVLVEARALELAGALELVEHAVDDALGGVADPLAALGLGRGLGRVADAAHELQVQLVGELEHRGRVAGLRGRLLDRRRGDALGEHRHALVDERADHARGEEAARVVDDDRGLADLLGEVERAVDARRRRSSRP